jgi:hypothetical protein
MTTAKGPPDLFALTDRDRSVDREQMEAEHSTRGAIAG